MKSWSDSHGLGTLPNWYYGTGTPATLAQVASAYGVPIQLDPTNKTVVHGTEIFFISPAGRETALGQFGTESADTAPFAHAIAQAADDLLPAHERTSIAGPSLPQTGAPSTALGEKPGTIVLPSLTQSSAQLSTSAQGKYTVLNFWASTCTACQIEMPDFEKAHQFFGSNVTFLGIDVTDNQPAALAFARSVGVTYPLARDTSGKARRCLPDHRPSLHGHPGPERQSRDSSPRRLYSRTARIRTRDARSTPGHNMTRSPTISTRMPC